MYLFNTKASALSLIGNRIIGNTVMTCSLTWWSTSEHEILIVDSTFELVMNEQQLFLKILF